MTDWWSYLSEILASWSTVDWNALLSQWLSEPIIPPPDNIAPIGPMGEIQSIEPTTDLPNIQGE